MKTGRFFIISLAMTMSCITDPGTLPSNDFGRGNIRVSEKNNSPARVFLDYRETGFTAPVTLENIPEGNHTLHLFYENHTAKPESMIVAVKEKTVSDATFEMVKSFANGSLEIRTTPQGATVSINSVDFGTSPIVVAGLPAETYQVRACLGNVCASGLASVTPDKNRVMPLILVPEKFVAIEYFSNTNCPPCPAAGAAIEALIESIPEYKDMICKITYHTNFPGTQDPFYLAAKNGQKQRMDYYRITAAPAIFINGESITANAQLAESIKKKIEALFGESAQAELFFGPLRRDSLTVSGDVTVKTALTGTRLTIAIIEDFVGYRTPPGTNGQKSFDNIFRGIAPQADTLEITGPEQAVSFTIDISAYSGSDLSLVAFIDDRVAKKIVQSLRIPLQ
jgi:hypothetical protein